MRPVTIRKIEKNDNIWVKELVQKVLIEMGVPKVVTAYEDPSLNTMFENYEAPQKCYFVVEENGKIKGGAGIAPLENGDPKICELQKMYFLPELRGKGIGAELMQTCLLFAREADYEKCYLETLPYMENARKLYFKSGFMPLDAPLGDTGHYNCTMWMIKDL